MLLGTTGWTLVRLHAERGEWRKDLMLKYQTFDLTDVWYNLIFSLGWAHKKSLEHKRKRTEKFASHELHIKLSFHHSDSIFHPPSIEVARNKLSLCNHLQPPLHSDVINTMTRYHPLVQIYICGELRLFPSVFVQDWIFQYSVSGLVCNVLGATLRRLKKY